MLWIQRCLYWRILFLASFSWMALSIISFVQWKWACSEVGNTVWMAWCQTINFHRYQHSVNTAGDSIRKSWSILYCKMHYLIYAGTVTTEVAVRAGKWILWWWKSWRRSEWILWPVSAGTAGIYSRDLVFVTVGRSFECQGLLGRGAIVLAKWGKSIFSNVLAKAAEENFNLGMDRDSWWQWHKWGSNGPDCQEMRGWGAAMVERGSVGRGWEDEEGELSPWLGMGRCGALPRDRGWASRERTGWTGEQLMLGMLCWVSATDTWLMGRTSRSNCN